MTAQKEYEQLAAELVGRGVKLAQMFGMPTLKNADGKAFAGLHGEAVAFRLGKDTDLHATALKLSGAHLFDPSGMGRPMKDWVEVPARHSDHYEEFAVAALDLLG